MNLMKMLMFAIVLNVVIMLAQSVFINNWMQENFVDDVLSPITGQTVVMQEGTHEVKTEGVYDTTQRSGLLSWIDNLINMTRFIGIFFNMIFAAFIGINLYTGAGIFTGIFMPIELIIFGFVAFFVAFVNISVIFEFIKFFINKDTSSK